MKINKSGYTQRRAARLRFLAGVGVCFMLIAAAVFVGFAVFIVAADTQNVSVFSPLEVKRDAQPAFTYITPSEAENFYARLPFYLPANSELYAEFSRDRPELDMETVIWKVNARVHVPFYSEFEIVHDANPLLISPAFRLPYDFTPRALVPVNNDECHLRATPETVAAFHVMRESAWAAGFDLSVVSAYRTAARQSQLWENGGRRDGRVARPHHSEHQTGRAIDFWGPGGLLDARESTPTGRWAAANAHNYGFILRYRAETTHITGYIFEPWHFTYVGLEISTYMHNSNILSLEEFVGRNPGATLPPI